MATDGASKRPKVSLGLPVYNGENFLEATLASLLAQTFEDFELIISDNASSDRTQEICLDHAARDPRIKYIRQSENLGAAANYDFVFHQARGDYFKWCAHDDPIAPDFLETCASCLNNDSDCVGALPKTVLLIDETDAVRGQASFDFGSDDLSAGARFAMWISDGYSHHCMPFFSLYRREKLALSQLHGDYLGSDRVLIGEMLLHGRIKLLGASSISFRNHPDQYSKLVSGNQSFGLAWLNPTQSSGRRVLRHCRYVQACVQAVRRARVPFRERRLAYVSILEFIWRERRRFVRELALPLYRNGQPNSVGLFLKRVLQRR